MLEFTVFSLKAGQSTDVTYSVNENVSMSEFNAMIAPVGNFSFAPIDTTPETEVIPDKTTPDANVAPGDTTPGTDAPAPMDYTMIIIVSVIILVIAGVAYYKREDIQKMLK